jgi:ribonuclease P protein component
MTVEQPPPTVTSPGAFSRLTPNLFILRKRAEFLRAARAKRASMDGFLLQARLRDADELPDPNAVRIGFTCSKKLGNAVARNRAKRRLREIARLVLGDAGQPGWDYVLVGRPDKTAALPFNRLQADLVRALARVHG